MEAFNSNLYQGSRLSKWCGSLSFILLIAAVAVLFGGHWLLTLALLIASGGFTYISYRLAGGRRNPEAQESGSSRNRRKIPSPEEFGRTLAEIFLESCSKTGVERLRDALGFPSGLHGFGPEAILLQMFMENYSVQVVFIHNQDYRDKLLDEFHGVVYKSVTTAGQGYPEVAATPNLVKERYKQYYDIVHKGMDSFMNEAPAFFLRNVLERKAEQELNEQTILIGSYSEKYGTGLMTMKLWLGETIKELIDTKKNMCKKYRIPT
jgi:hypothetical protein